MSCCKNEYGEKGQVHAFGESGQYLVARLPGNVVVVNIERSRRWLHLAQANRRNVGLVPVQPSRWVEREKLKKRRVSNNGGGRRV